MSENNIIDIIYDIIIIGAGASGLQSAKHIIQTNTHEFKVCILEGRNRIGNIDYCFLKSYHQI